MSGLPYTPPPAPPPLRRRRLPVMKILGFVLSAIIGAVGGLIFISLLEMPDMSGLKRSSRSPATRLYDSADPPQLIAQLTAEQRTFVPLARMPRTLLDATVAIEDQRFFIHWGLDLWGIARATVINVFHGRVVEGASTITQQLARTLFLNLERTFRRKINEALLAIQIERHYKKEEILEMYLNQIFFGHGAYGAEQAARFYFGKHVEELTLPESALLAGLPRAPNNYSPRNNPEKAVQRRNLVLSKMVENGFVEPAEAEEASRAPLNLRRTEQTNAPYFAAHFQKRLEDKYGNQAVYRGALSVHTTLNLRLQKIAQRALEDGLRAAEGAVKNVRGESAIRGLQLQGALIALDPRTGAIRAMIGGRNFKEYQYNRATQALRQPGSSFKPFIYATALENGFTPADIIDDSPVQYTGKDGDVWQPTNFSRKLYGDTTLRRALAFSRNIVTVKLLDQLKVSNVAKRSKRYGFTSRIRWDLTLALGTSEVNLLELVSAYSVFANGGIRAAPYSVEMVKDTHGNILEQHRPEMDRVIPPQVAYLMLSMLKDTIEYGTAKVVRRLGFARPAAGKTGSTNNFTDAWFIGFTPTLACGVWIGYDDCHTMGKNAVGSALAAPVWTTFMAEALEATPARDFERPDGLVEAQIDRTSGLLATRECTHVITELFLEESVPTRKCNRHERDKTFVQDELEQLEKMYTEEDSTPAE